ncbi:hypothetical protein FQR65_LT03676 [Abscondita terminalis]|nr:hypothetical protein FQR65_LT03676 [Abscondita terminalis]
MENEHSFPRGSIKKTENNSFTDEPIRFEIGKRKRSKSESHVVNRKRPHVSEIYYGNIQEGMLVLGCVRSISTMAFEVELPGKMCGKIMITSVSEPLTKLLEEKVKSENVDKTPALHSLFHIGQFIPTKVLDKTTTETSTSLVLSTNPSDVHQGWTNANFVKGRCIWGSVELELEHGYQLNVGISSCRVFLPFKNIQNDAKYVIGQPLYSVVQKCTLDSNTSTIVVSTLEKDMSKAMSNDHMDLLHLTPGSCINFTITDVLANGLKGTFSKQTGYVHEAYLNNSYEDISFDKYNNGDNFKAFLLYVQPDTKCAYFSLRGISSSSQPDFRNGSKLSSEVFKIVHSGVFIKLPKSKVGFVSARRFRKNFGNYSVGSQHPNTRILDYRRLENLYICCFEASDEGEPVVEEEKQSPQVGNSVVAKVVKITNAGVVVNFGVSKGFIPNIHLNDELNVEVDNEIKAKVWKVNDDGISLTTKLEFLNSDVCLKTINDIVVGEQYHGIVLHKNPKGILIGFYGDIKGILPNNYVNQIFGPNAYDVFIEGEVVSLKTFFYVVKVDPVILRLNVPEKPKVKQGKFNVGEYVTGTVLKVCSNGLEVAVGSQDNYVFVPTAHISACILLTPLLLNSYQQGEVIDELLCLTNIGTPVFSIREAKAYRKNNLKIMSMSELTSGSIIRCSVLKDFDNRIRVLAPLTPESKILHIYKNDLDKETIHNYRYQQLIPSKVTKINHNKKIIKLTARSEELCQWDYNDALDYLQQYLEDVRRINTRSKEKFSISELFIGQRVDCTVKSITDEKCLVVVQENVEGIVERRLAERNIGVGESVEGVVLWKDFIDDRVILSLKQDVNDRVGSEQETYNVNLEDTVKAYVLVIKPQFIITVTDDKHILFVPVLKRNYYLRPPYYRLFQELRVIVVRKVGNTPIAVDKSMLNVLENAKKAFINKTSPVKKKEEPVKNLKVRYKHEELENGESVTAYNNSSTLNEVFLNNSKSVAALPGVKGFFTTKNEIASESSSAEDEVEVTEERIRNKEIEIADGSAEPQTEEQFERLVTGQPNNSELWAKYIAYCVSNAEIHKARNIAKAALKRIDLNQTEERYNIWLTLLNLENNYGDKESFNGVFEEAVRCNDDLNIYLDVVGLLADSEKYLEMNEKIKKVKNKHKHNPKMWTGLALVYYKCGKLKDARNIQSSALKTIENKSNHVDLIVQFAIMEFNYGEKHHAEALFETILQSNPKRVDVWSTYVDQMIKKENIEGARRVLERAVSQHIPPKKMKTLFKKYKDLELRHGDEERVAHVVNLARQYLGDK